MESENKPSSKVRLISKPKYNSNYDAERMRREEEEWRVNDSTFTDNYNRIVDKLNELFKYVNELDKLFQLNRNSLKYIQKRLVELNKNRELKDKVVTPFTALIYKNGSKFK